MMNKAQVCIVAFLVSCQLHAQSIFDLQSCIAYGNFLYSNKAYTLAATEFERALLLGGITDSTRFKLAACYYFSKNATRANRVLQLANDTNSYVIQKTRYACLKSSQPNILKEIPDQWQQHPQGALLRADAYILAGAWDGALNELQKASNELGSYKKRRYELIVDALQTKYKSPVVAASLSALVPGLGKVYTSEWRDGIFAFVLLAASGVGLWRSYETLGLDHPWTVTISALTAGMYLGNIYGSYFSAIKLNRKKKDKLNERAKNLVFSLD